MNRALSILALAALTACGGGGGGGGGFMPTAAAPEPAPVKEVALAAPTYVAPNCTQKGGEYPHMSCDMTASEQPIGVHVPAKLFAAFTNNTGTYLQINEISAYTGERQFWSEHCTYLVDFKTAQSPAGRGEVGCATKNIGEDYAPIRFGDGTGLLVAPGEVVYLNSHTDPSSVGHTYTMKVTGQTTALYSWRQPQVDRVIHCDDQMQATDMVPWRNDTGKDLHLIGASIYAETPSSATPNMLAAACIYVMTADGMATKYRNCDSAIRTRGEVSFPVVTIAPGEYVSAQASNACKTGNHWNWVAFLRVW